MLTASDARCFIRWFTEAPGCDKLCPNTWRLWPPKPEKFGGMRAAGSPGPASTPHFCRAAIECSTPEGSIVFLSMENLEAMVRLILE